MFPVKRIACVNIRGRGVSRITDAINVRRKSLGRSYRRYHNSLTLCETVSCAELATRTAGNNGGVRPTLFTTLLVINMEEPPSLAPCRSITVKYRIPLALLPRNFEATFASRAFHRRKKITPNLMSLEGIRVVRMLPISGPGICTGLFAQKVR